MSLTTSADNLELELLEADLDELEAAWIDEEFAAIIALNWAGEPPSPTLPGRLPARWPGRGPADPPAQQGCGGPRRLAAARPSRQRSPPR